MARFTKRGPKVVYIAGSAREFPVEVRDWLSRTSNRATAITNIYEALALLAIGRKPDAIIVSIEVVDWNEMDFFEQAARLSPQTRFYVTGHDYSRAKLESARQRGAVLFDADVLDRELQSGQPSGSFDKTRRLVAGASPPVLTTPRVTPDEPLSPQTRDNAPEEEASPAEPTDHPHVRLVREQIEDSDDDTPVYVPWAPNPDRPKRTPPGDPPSSPTAESTTGKPDAEADPTSERKDPVKPIELTADELAALLGKPAPAEPRGAKEQQR